MNIVRLLLFIICMSYIQAVDVPDWVLVGIAKVETRSYYTATDLIWVDRARGRAGERGAFQITYRAWKDVSLPGERFSQLEHDPWYAEKIATRYLSMLYKRCKSWDKAIMYYNAGYGNPSRTYLKRVKSAARRAGYAVG